ncbi:hypothetical protein [Deinococcus sp. UYEF24]
MTEPFSFPFQISAGDGTYPARFVAHEEDGFLDVEVDDVQFTLSADGVHYGLQVDSDDQRRVADHLRATLKITSESSILWFDTVPEDAHEQALELYEQQT